MINPDWFIPEPNSGCWIWVRASRHRYGAVKFDGKIWQAHRLSWRLCRGPIPRGLKVLHRCDVPECVNPDHLFLGTQADNMRDMARKGRSTIGERNPGAKLTYDDVREVRQMRERGMTIRAIAARLHVGHASIGRIASGESWVLPPKESQDADQ